MALTIPLGPPYPFAAVIFFAYTLPFQISEKENAFANGEAEQISQKGTRLWIINKLKFDNPGVKINPRYKKAEFMSFLEKPRLRSHILNAMMSTTNGDLIAAYSFDKRASHDRSSSSPFSSNTYKDSWLPLRHFYHELIRRIIIIMTRQYLR